MVELTEAGEATFIRLQQTAVVFDARLRAGLSEPELERLRDLLGRLAANADGAEADDAPPWAGLAEPGRPG